MRYILKFCQYPNSSGESLLSTNRQLETSYPSLKGHTLTITQPSNANAKFKINIQSESVVATKLEGLNVQTGAKTGKLGVHYSSANHSYLHDCLVNTLSQFCLHLLLQLSIVVTSVVKSLDFCPSSSLIYLYIMIGRIQYKCLPATYATKSSNTDRYAEFCF